MSSLVSFPRYSWAEPLFLIVVHGFTSGNRKAIEAEKLLSGGVAAFGHLTPDGQPPATERAAQSADPPE